MERTGRSGKEYVDQTGVAGTEGGRRPTGVPATPAAAATGEGSQGRPDPEVLETPTRRRFTAEYKLRILQEADHCTDPGQVGALLRREGLYSSHLTTWRRQRERGSRAALSTGKRGRRAKRTDPLAEENQRLRREIQRLGAELKKAHTIIEVQKKLSEVLGVRTEMHSRSETDE